MAIDTQITVSLDGTIFKNIIDFSLEENVGKHTKFTVSVRGQSMEDRLNGNSILESSRVYLGKPFSLEISGLEGFGYEKFYFKGTITQVRGKKGKEEGGMGDIIDVVGYSNSILLDDGPHMNSFLEKNLSDIVLDTTAVYSNSNIIVATAPENDSVISYAVQNKQSTFKYLQYLAASNGEYLLYNSDTLYFGKPTIGVEIELKYGFDLKDFSLGLETQSLNFDYYSNDYFSESTSQASGSSMNSNATGYTAMVTNASNEVYPESNQLLFSTFEDVNLQQRIDTAVGLQKKIAEQNQVTLYGESVNTGVSLGKIINIKSNEGSFGSYRVTNVKHAYGIRGKYKNTFTAVPLEIDIYPLTNIAIVNKAQAQIGKVTNATDPEGMSRIQVQFPWQVATSGTTPWIRVATSYAGGNRGFHFLPEVGDEVLVGFENGEVERPFMQAALYTGANKPEEWQTDANNVKAIRTRSGHTIELNDTEGEEKINIYDNEGSIIIFDTVAKSLTINATETIDIGAKNINIVAEENITIQAQGDIITAAEGDISIQSQGATDIQATGDASLVSSGAVTVEATSDATLAGANAVVSGQASAELNGAQAKVAGSAMTEISGGIVKVN